MNNDKNIKSLIKNDYLTIKKNSDNIKIGSKISRRILIKNSKKVFIVSLVSLIGAAVFSYSLAMLLNY